MLSHMHSRAVMHWGPFVGRVLLSIIFIAAGFQKLTGFSGAVGYIASAGLPMPEVLAVLAIIIELGGGLMLLTGFMARVAAKALFFFIIIVTVVYHNFFNDPTQMIMALKNLGLMGGMLMVFVHGPGPVSLRCWCPKCKDCGKCHMCEVGNCGMNHGQ